MPVSNRVVEAPQGVGVVTQGDGRIAEVRYELEVRRETRRAASPNLRPVRVPDDEDITGTLRVLDGDLGEAQGGLTLRLDDGRTLSFTIAGPATGDDNYLIVGNGRLQPASR